MLCHNKNNTANQPPNNPEVDHVTLELRRDLVVELPDEDIDLLDELQEDEIEMDISIDDSSVIWDLRQLFDLDFLARDVSPFPRGDSADIPSEVFRTVSPVQGDGCPDDNNMNISQQTNQNNIQGETKRSNTNLRSLTRAIHDSDQVKDILFGSVSKPKDPVVQPILLPSRQFRFDTNDGEQSIKYMPQNQSDRNGNSSYSKPIYRRPREYIKEKSRRHKYDYSSSSESSSDSSCSCSRRKYKSHNHCHPPVCHGHNQNLCQHQCNSVPLLNTSLPITNNSNSTHESNQNLVNSGFLPGQPFPSYMMPNVPWSVPYIPQMEYNDMMLSQQFAPMPPYIDSNTHSSSDMSDIIERIHKLDISISNLTKSSCYCNPQSDPSVHQDNSYYNGCFGHH